MITLRSVSKSFGNQDLLEEASLQINEGDRYALVGPNGAGKSTLFRILMGREEPDSGEVSRRAGVTFGYLPQETAEFHRDRVLAEVTASSPSDAIAEARAKKVLAGLGFKPSEFDRPIQELSGGWRMRVAIARLLLEEPDLLLLDEPTNHLDLETLLWFQDYLRSCRSAIFLISHDREFINSVTTRIVEVRERKLQVYTGSFEEFLAQKNRDEDNRVAAYKRQQKEIEEIETFIRTFRAKATIASRVQAKIKYLEKLERIELPESVRSVGFSFPQPARSGRIALALAGLGQSYDRACWVYRGLDLELERGQRVALVGPNGAGKSTLVKLLAGAIPFQEGSRRLGHNVEVGYFSQHRPEMFTPGRTVFEEAADTRRAHGETTIRTVLGSFLFRGEAVFKKVEVLSGGEKSRLGLVKLLLDPPNVLLLDEPTTHLDMASVEVLIEALKNFDGTLVLISHDVYFIRQIANHVLHVVDGKVTWYPGDYDYFLHKKALEEGEEAELFRSEERIERSRRHGPPSPGERGGARGESARRRPSPDDARASSPSPIGRGMPGHPSVHGAPSGSGKSPKSKEQKRREAEERQARYRRDQEEKRQQAVLKDLKGKEALLLTEMARVETHQNPARVVELSKRLAEIRKEIRRFQTK